jgi:diadenylate cyclase
MIQFNFLIQWFDFSRISIFSVLDFLIVALFIFIFLRAVRGTPALQILIAILICSGIYLLTNMFNMPMLQSIFRTIIPAGLIGMIVVFQPEIRKLLIHFGKNSPLGKNGFITKFLKSDNIDSIDEQNHTAEQIAKCLVYCVANKIGALIILLPNKDVEYTIDSGVAINGILSSKLLESIFEKQSPLHDGAVVIQGNQILSAKVIMPVTSNTLLPVRVGLRHRAAIGASEHHDLLAIVVSEEKNTISYAQDGKLFENQSIDNIKKQVILLLNL